MILHKIEITSTPIMINYTISKENKIKTSIKHITSLGLHLNILNTLIAESNSKYFFRSVDRNISVYIFQYFNLKVSHFNNALVILTFINFIKYRYMSTFCLESKWLQRFGAIIIKLQRFSQMIFTSKVNNI